MFVRSWLLRVRWWIVVLVIGVHGLAWWMHPAYEMSGFATETPWDDNTEITSEPEMSRRFVSSDLDDFVHSSSITALPGGNLMSVWFAGTREGAADVQIRGARFDAASRFANWGIRSLRWRRMTDCGCFMCRFPWVAGLVVRST